MATISGAGTAGRRGAGGAGRRMLGRALLLVVLLIAAPAVPAGAAEALVGRYVGIDEATGARLVVESGGPGVTADLREADGQARRFDAAVTRGVAEATLAEAGGRLLFRMTPLPLGAEVVLVPVEASGRAVAERARRLVFLREGTELPAPPEGFVPPPPPGRMVTGGSFLASYEFWPGAGVRDGYLGLTERVRTLIRLFPAVQLDVIWKLCLSPGADAALAIALRGQGVGCAEVIETIAAAQSRGRFDDFKDEVAEQKAVLAQSVRCGERHVESKADCDRASRRVAEAAVTLETAATVLRRYR